MARLLIRKLTLMVLFLPLLHLLGFYYTSLFGPHLLPHLRNMLPEQHGTEDVFQRYKQYIEGVLTGDLGTVAGISISQLITPRITNSLILLVLALLMTVVLGLLLGVAAISPRTRRTSAPALLVLTAGSGIPGFLLGMVAIALVIYGSRYYWPGRGGIMPIQGFGLDAHLILPVLTLASRPMLYVARITAGLLEHELQQEYVLVARSKGLSWRAVLRQHAFPNIRSAVVVTLGQAMRLLVSGLILVETLFDWPGVGHTFMTVIGLRTGHRTPLFAQPELLATIAVLFGMLLLLADMVSSMLAYWADPRLRRSTEHEPA